MFKPTRLGNRYSDIDIDFVWFFILWLRNGSPLMANNMKYLEADSKLIAGKDYTIDKD